jgi:hypothetical protein
MQFTCLFYRLRLLFCSNSFRQFKCANCGWGVEDIIRLLVAVDVVFVVRRREGTTIVSEAETDVDVGVPWFDDVVSLYLRFVPPFPSFGDFIEDDGLATWGCGGCGFVLFFTDKFTVGRNDEDEEEDEDEVLLSPFL